MSQKIKNVSASLSGARRKGFNDACQQVESASLKLQKLPDSGNQTERTRLEGIRDRQLQRIGKNFGAEVRQIVLNEVAAKVAARAKKHPVRDGSPETAVHAGA